MGDSRKRKKKKIVWLPAKFFGICLWIPSDLAFSKKNSLAEFQSWIALKKRTLFSGPKIAKEIQEILSEKFSLYFIQEIFNKIIWLVFFFHNIILNITNASLKDFNGKNNEQDLIIFLGISDGSFLDYCQVLANAGFQIQLHYKTFEFNFLRSFGIQYNLSRLHAVENFLSLERSFLSNASPLFVEYNGFIFVLKTFVNNFLLNSNVKGTVCLNFLTDSKPLINYLDFIFFYYYHSEKRDLARENSWIKIIDTIFFYWIDRIIQFSFDIIFIIRFIGRENILISQCDWIVRGIRQKE